MRKLLKIVSLSMLLLVIGLIISLCGCSSNNQIKNDSSNIVRLNSMVNSSSNEQIITEYEEKIIKNRGSWSDVQKGINLVAGLSQTILGFYTANPIAIAGGTCGAAGALGSIFLGGGPTLGTVTKQLNQIEKKIDSLSNQMDNNQKQLINETIRTQAMIDQVKVNQYNQNIQAYYTDYVKPIDDFMLIYKDLLEQEYRKYANTEHILTIYYGKDGKVLFKSEQDITGSNTMNFEISDFSNVQAYLKKNRGIVGDEYPNELYKDIKNALNSQILPIGKNIDSVADDVYQTISEEVNQNVLTKEDSVLHSKVLQFVSDFVSLSKAISGINFESVINSYIARLECMYNFSKEIKNPIRDLLSHIKYHLDNYLCAAQTACIAQKINYVKEIATSYTQAADYIKDRYEKEMAVPNNYSYCIKNVVNADLYHIQANVYFTELGNYPTFHANFKLLKNIKYTNGNIGGDAEDINKINMLDYSKILAISTRYNLLKSAGITKSESFIKYLEDLAVLPSGKISLAKDLLNSGKYNNPFRILASFAIRDLDYSDSFFLKCTCYGNPKSEYFHIGEVRKYRHDDGVIEAEYWSGKMAYGDILDAKTCQMQSQKRITAYAKYSESHRLWVNDEHWGFVDDIYGNLFFILTAGR